jgi:hypothetical protein
MLGREGKNGVVQASRGKTGFRNNKNNTIEASMLLKTNECVCKTKLKRTQIEPQLSAEMHAIRVKFELSSTSQVLAEASNGKEIGGRNRPVGGIKRTAREYENRGNEAKKCLKTKDITFLKVANFACFVRKLTAISPQREQMAAHSAKTKSRLATPSVSA